MHTYEFKLKIYVHIMGAYMQIIPRYEVSMIKTTTGLQGGHVLADMKFPVFSLCCRNFPCVFY